MLDYVKKNLRDVIAFGVLGLFVFILGVFLKFPYEKVFNGAISNIERQYNLSLKIESISPSLPIGIKAENIEFSGRDFTAGKPLKLESLKIKIPIIGLILYPFTKSLSYKFAAALQKGTISGNVRNGKSSLDLSIESSSLNLESVAPLTSRSGLLLSGIANLKFVSAIPKTDPAKFDILKGRGEINFDATNFSIQGQPSQGQETGSSFMTMLSAMPISFSKVSTKAILNSGIIEIRELNIEREGLTGKLNGVVKLSEAIEDSILDISLNLNLSPTEGLVRPLLSIYGQNIGCPLNPDNSVSCKIKGTIRQLASPY